MHCRSISEYNAEQGFGISFVGRSINEKLITLVGTSLFRNYLEENKDIKSIGSNKDGKDRDRTKKLGKSLREILRG